MKTSIMRNYCKMFAQEFNAKSNINYSRFSQQNAKQMIRCESNILKKESKLLMINEKSLIELRPKRHYSVALQALVLGQVAPIVGVILGRVLQNRWKNMSPTNRRKVVEWISENRWIYLFFLTAIITTFHCYYRSFVDETPFTKRKRFVIFLKEDYEPISQMLFQIFYNTYKPKILPINHETSRRVNQVVQRLLESNANFEELQKNWSVFVIKDPNIKNAFVFPTGQIFVYTGIIRVCDNDSQLGAILAHELSHALLAHGNEVLSHEVLKNFGLTIITLILWTRFKAIKALINTVISGLALKIYSNLPFKHLIEIEADFMGLYITAKACYDVRESSAFWRKMAALETVNTKTIFSTHPSNTERYEYLDSYINDMIKLMECSDCPKLSETDPRQKIDYQFSKAIKGQSLDKVSKKLT